MKLELLLQYIHLENKTKDQKIAKGFHIRCRLIYLNQLVEISPRQFQELQDNSPTPINNQRYQEMKS